MAFPVKICWANSYVPDPNAVTWTELCAVVLERFGLPGNLYTTEITADYMIFNFKTAEDALIAKLTLGDHAKE